MSNSNTTIAAIATPQGHSGIGIVRISGPRAKKIGEEISQKTLEPNKFIYSRIFDDNKIIICVPNTFTKAWLENKYHEKILKALEEVSEKKIEKMITKYPYCYT